MIAVRALRLPRPIRRPGRRAASRSTAVPVAAVQPVPPLSPRLQMVRAVLVMVAVLCLVLLLHVTVLSSLQQQAAQRLAYADFRQQVANGQAVAGPSTEDGSLLELGAPVAHLEIPQLGLSEVVLEGTTSGVLFDGPGHRRDTPLPGQVGTSVVLGRRAAFGGPFGDLERLRAGDEIAVTTAQGRFVFRVLAVRRAGDPLPAPRPAGSSRLVLVTASGTPFLPNGIISVDADLDGTAVGGAARPFSAATLPDAERALSGDTSRLVVLLLWLQALFVCSLLFVVSWHRWGRAQTWLVIGPPLVVVALFVGDEVVRVLPNLM
jgi:sortase A